MSDETPQKGWDSWFGGQPESSGDEQGTPEQGTPEQAARTQAAPAVPAQQPREPAPAAVPDRVADVEPEAVPEPEATQVPPAPPENEAEQTNWTVPTLGAVLEGGDDAQATQLDADEPAAVPPPRHGGAHSGRRVGYGQSGPRQPEQEKAAESAPAPEQASELASVLDPDQAATQWMPQRPAREQQPQRQEQEQESQQEQADQVATQWMPQNADQAATQWAPRGAGQDQGQNPDQAATQWAPRGMGQAPDQAPDQLATQYLGQQTPVPPAKPAAPAQPTAPTAPAWQTPQPAQMWSSAPGRIQPQQQAYPQHDAGRPPRGGGEDEWSGWDEEPQRRGSDPAPMAGGGYGSGGGNPSGSGGSGYGSGEGGRSGSRRKLMAAGGVGVAGIVGLVTVLLLNQTGSGSAGAAAKPSGFQPTATTVAGDAQETASAFLSAWASGDFQQAANYTDDPSAALSMLTAYKNGLNLAGLQLTAQNATADSTAAAAGSASASSTASGAAAVTKSGTVTFGVAAKVGLPASSTTSAGASGSASAGSSATGSSASSSATASGSGPGSAAVSNVTGNWSYSSKLTAYERNGGWWVKWDPALVAPNLTAGEKIVSVAIPPTASKVTDASGTDLADATDPGVRNIAAALKKAAPVGQGTPGVEIELEGANGKPIASTADVLVQPVATGAVKTTINPAAEAAAQAAVQKYKDSSMVVIKPSTGEILAVANNDGQNDFALTARVAPGSTNKIITSTALLANNLVTSPSQAVACPKSITVNGTTFANSQNESEPAGTPFLTDFAVSCNNAFGQWYDKIGSSTLAQTAQKYYGLNEQWDIGLGAAGPYYTIPSSSSNGELFQELFGQGQLEAAPIAMASVAATVDSGSFKQPIVVAGAAQQSATPLPSSVQQDLWQMMKAVTTQSDGTAYGVFSGVNSQVYGKTGTADVGSGGTKQQNPNSWMVVFDPTLDLAIGCVVLNAGYGASFAGPETASVLKALQ